MKLLNYTYISIKTILVGILALTAFHWCNIVKYADLRLNKYPYTISEVSSHNYVIDLKTQITNDTPKYEELYQFMLSRTSEDKVTFKIYGYGGAVTSAILVINGIKETKAKVYGYVSSSAYSAHGYITCAIPKTNVKWGTYSYIMLHGVQSSKKPSKKPSNEMTEASVNRMITECNDKGYMTPLDANRIMIDNQNEYYYWNGKKVG